MKLFSLSVAVFKSNAKNDYRRKDGEIFWHRWL